MDDLTSTAGIVALVAGGLALLGLVASAGLWLRLKRIRAAQRAVLGETGEGDLVFHAQRLERRLDELARLFDEERARLSERADLVDRRLERTISHAAVVRYDAYDEMSGRQSSSVALVDGRRTGVVLSSILHREQARVYAKQLVEGESEIELSPEEHEAVRAAMGARSGGDGGRRATRD